MIEKNSIFAVMDVDGYLSKNLENIKIMSRLEMLHTFYKTLIFPRDAYNMDMFHLI
jgi:hypothetical protein